MSRTPLTSEKALTLSPKMARSILQEEGNAQAPKQ